jgi:subtilisin-like proprotein convertase family protein
MVKVDPLEHTTLYAGTDLGVYRSIDSGASWTRFGDGLPLVSVRDIYLAPDGSFMRIGTHGRGVWEMQGITTNYAPQFTAQPQSLTVYDGQPALLGSVAVGLPAPTFQWEVSTDGTSWATVSPNGTANSYLVSSALAGDSGKKFRVLATNSVGTATSSVATLTVLPPVPVTFPTQPANTTAAVGHTATFSVSVQGTGPFAYQWKKSGVAISGATSASYTTPVLALADSGTTYLCEVTGRAGMVPSSTATLTVQGLGSATNANNSTITAIPDSPSPAVEIPFTVSGVTGNIGEVTFSIYLTHTWLGDLEFTLMAPDSSSVVLASAINGGNIGKTDGTSPAFGTSCGNYTVFSDLGTTSIQAQTSANLPLVGTFRPSGALAAFNGKSANGTWKLLIKDVGPEDIGAFQCGVLSVKPFLTSSGPSFNMNGDSATDVYDLLEFLKLYGSTAPADLAKADFNTDGQINDADLTALLNAL